MYGCSDLLTLVQCIHCSLLYVCQFNIISQPPPSPLILLPKKKSLAPRLEPETFSSEVHHLHHLAMLALMLLGQGRALVIPELKRLWYCFYQANGTNWVKCLALWSIAFLFVHAQFFYKMLILSMNKRFIST